MARELDRSPMSLRCRLIAEAVQLRDLPRPSTVTRPGVGDATRRIYAGMTPRKIKRTLGSRVRRRAYD